MYNFIYIQILSEVWGTRKGSWGRRKGQIITLLKALDPQPSKIRGQITFNVLDKDLKIIEGKKRLRLSPGRFLSRQLKLNNRFFNDKTLRKISDNILKKYFPEIEISLDKGEKITQNYVNEVGGHSCMTGKHAECTKLYEMNPDRFEQLVMKYNNDSARAIIFNLDCGKKLMGRVYSTSNFLFDKMIEMGNEKGWIEGNTPYDKQIITGLKFEDGHVPYLDSLYYYKIVDNKLNIFGNSSLLHDGLLDFTDGHIYGGYYCISCEERHVEEELTIINDECYCDYCRDNNFTVCCSCNEWIHCDEVLITWNGFTLCHDCFDDETVKCDDCTRVFYDYELTETKSGEVCDDCIKRYFLCKNCDCLFLDKNLTDGYCESCTEEQPSLFKEEENENN